MDNDESGRAVFAALRDAAQRGVRVRLLLDDLNSASAEPLLAALVDLPNFEIRLFNPFCCARQSLAGRIVTSLGDLPRLDHRMHNKLMIADGALAIVGGRNIADAYFGRDPVANFIDLDAIAAGRVVPSSACSSTATGTARSPFRQVLVRPLGPESERMAALARLLPDGAAPIDSGLPARDLLGREPVGKSWRRIG